MHVIMYVYTDVHYYVCVYRCTYWDICTDAERVQAGPESVAHWPRESTGAERTMMSPLRPFKTESTACSSAPLDPSSVTVAGPAICHVEYVRGRCQTHHSGVWLCIMSKESSPAHSMQKLLQLARRTRRALDRTDTVAYHWRGSSTICFASLFFLLSISCLVSQSLPCIDHASIIVR